VRNFPLRLKAGVSIQGDRRTKGSKIIINGGGTFLSPTFARQNIAILGANQASLSGVTVTNSNPRGYGLWIESSNLLVSDNTLREMLMTEFQLRVTVSQLFAAITFIKMARME
jgi:hypothetical protein